MTKYIIKPDIKNLEDPLFVWYLVFSDMSQNFNSIIDLYIDYAKKPEGRVKKFLIRISMGYSAEAQKTIRQFVNSKACTDVFLNLIDPDVMVKYKKLYERWREYNDNCIWKFSNSVRNDVFHFASDAKEVKNYETKFKRFLVEQKEIPELVLSINDYNENGRDFRDDMFCDVMWFYNIDKNYNEILNIIDIESDEYAKDLSGKLLEKLDLSHGFILFMRDILQSYFICKQIIQEIPGIGK